ncbi:mechanosensitive ion channel domain-containing protein [Mesorhizobium sp. KR2-14]|uniref:mechanosensitive ion channel family protein n=1 Tax=Mesorhizobium sp. KR2-14 TaxID=3156610 RepID=UPI0032B4CB77
MAQRSHFLRFFWPALFVTLSVAAYVFHGLAFQKLAPDADPNAVRQLSTAAAYYSGAWLLARIIGAGLIRAGNGRRKMPKLLRDLITAALFLAATIATVAMLLGQSAGGALASSGLIIAILGFAIRNVLADVLSGVALGLEAPFRIGDWIEIDGAIRGRVIEIGWRTTRLQTRNDTYMILPNSQISRQKLINYSAPRKHYRATLEIVLGHDIRVDQGKELLAAAAASTPIIMTSPKPDARALSYDTEGVRYAVRYWVPSFVDDIDCRDAILVAVDAAIRDRGLPPPFSRVKLLSSAV